MEFFKSIFFNYIFFSSFLSWIIAQVLKTILHYIKTKKLSFERITGSGGMPSSHSAVVTAMTIAIGKKISFSSDLFIVCFIFSLIVMYDSMGVRRATGENAKLINMMLNESNSNLEFQNSQKNEFLDVKLKELVGHKPIEVFAGFLLGIVVNVFIPVF